MTNVIVNGKTYRVKSPILFVMLKLDLPSDRVIWRNENGDWIVRYDTSLALPETLSSGTGSYRRDW